MILHIHKTYVNKPDEVIIKSYNKNNLLQPSNYIKSLLKKGDRLFIYSNSFWEKRRVYNFLIYCDNYLLNVYNEIYTIEEVNLVIKDRLENTRPIIVIGGNYGEFIYVSNACW